MDASDNFYFVTVIINNFNTDKIVIILSFHVS